MTPCSPPCSPAAPPSRMVVSEISHEMRNSLNAIVGFAEMLVQGFYGELTPEQSLGVSTILQAGTRLLDVVGHLMERACQESGQEPHPDQPVDLAALAAEEVAQIRGMIHEPDLRLELASPPDMPRLLANPAVIRQILYNLLSNAVNFSLPPGRIRVALSRRPDGGASVLVQDDGIGIPEAELRPLQAWLRPTLNGTSPCIPAPAGGRADDGGTPEARGDGTPIGGLGLAQVKSLLEACGGWLDLDSRIGQGTSARFNLPAARSLKEP